MGAPPVSQHDCRTDTTPNAQLCHRQPCKMSDSECLGIDIQTAKLLANRWVTDCHIQFTAPVFFMKHLDVTGLQMSVDN